MFNNILTNPKLSGFTLNRVHRDKNDNQRPVEYPNNWECVAFPLNPNDPDEVPASFHRDEGYGLAAGYMKWHCGYVQRGVLLRKGQRYLAKATFSVDMFFHEHPDTSPSADELKHLQWRFIFNEAGHQIESGWTSTAQGRFGVAEEALFVIDPIADITIDFGLFFQAFHPTTAGEIHIMTIELLEVPSDYGTAVVVGNPDRSNASAPVKPSQPVIPADSSPKSEDSNSEGRVANILNTMTEDDAQVIARGFRSAAQSDQFDAIASNGFIRFAEVLERFSKQE